MEAKEACGVAEELLVAEVAEEFRVCPVEEDAVFLDGVVCAGVVEAPCLVGDFTSFPLPRLLDVARSRSTPPVPPRGVFTPESLTVSGPVLAPSFDPRDVLTRMPA